MSAQPRPKKKAIDPFEPQDLIDLWCRVTHNIHQTWHQASSDHGVRGLMNHMLSPEHTQKTWQHAMDRWHQDPSYWMRTQQELLSEHFHLWHQVTQRLKGEEVSPVAQPDPQDRRFRDEAWSENVFFDYLKQSYLLSARSIRKTIHDLYHDDPTLHKQADFYTRQWLDACSPSNFCWTNPKVLQKILETGGKNVIDGLQRLCDDLEKSGGKFHFSTRADHAFVLGETLATTPGKVIYETPLFQLIQYEPRTPTVYQTPVLMIPPWIKKYYAFDLRPHNSWVKWLVEEGFTVFVLSWVNPDSSYRHTTLEDYALQGGLEALRVISKQCDRAPIHATGYCLGGTLLNCILAYLKKKPDPDVTIATGTFMTTLTDFSHVGDFSVFINDTYLDAIEQHMSQNGYMDGTLLASVFNMLRANDMIWSFIVNSYLLAQEPMPFDLLHWNADLMHLPAEMQRFILRHLYQKNELVKPHKIKMGGVGLNLRDIDTPAFLLSTQDDHIAPWEATYAATQLYKGPVKFVLSGSGHVAGVINPPSQIKYGYWTQDQTPSDPTAWLNQADMHEGSWWLEWLKWLKPYSAAQVPARHPSHGFYPPLEDAPGRYAQMRCT